MQAYELFTILENAFDKVVAAIPQSNFALLRVTERIIASIRSLGNHGFQQVLPENNAMSELQIWEQALKLSKESAKALEELTVAMNENDQIMLDGLRSLSESFEKLASDECLFWASLGESKGQNLEDLALEPVVQESPTGVGQLSSAQASDNTFDAKFASAGWGGQSSDEGYEANTQQSMRLMRDGPAKHPEATFSISRQVDDGPTSSITGKRISLEEHERRKTQVTEGAVDEMGTVIVRGLDNRLAEFNEISSIFKDMINDSGVNLADNGLPGLTSPAPEPEQQEVSGDSIELLASQNSGFKATPSTLPDRTIEQQSGLKSTEPIPDSNELPNIPDMESLKEDQPMSFYDEYMRDRRNDLQGSESEAATGASSVPEDSFPPDVAGGQPSDPGTIRRPAAKEYITQPPQPGLEAAITKARATGKPVGIMQPPSPSALAAVGTLSVGIGLAIASLPPGGGDEFLTGAAALSKMQGLGEAMASPSPDATNTTQSSMPAQAMNKLQSIVPVIGDFQMLNLPSVDPTKIMSFEAQADSLVRNLGQVNQKTLDSVTEDVKTWRDVVEKNVSLSKLRNLKGTTDPSDQVDDTSDSDM